MKRLPKSAVRSLNKIIERLELWQARNQQYAPDIASEINAPKHKLLDILRDCEHETTKGTT